MQNQIIRWAGGLVAVALLQADPSASGTPPTAPDPAAEAGTEAASTEDVALDATEPTPPSEGDEVGEATAGSADSGHAYQAIIFRNSFGLREPPPPPAPVAEPPPPINASALKLTGITTLLGKRAMFAFSDGRTNLVSSLVREGEWDPIIKDLEVLQIDAVTRSVRVRFGGKEMQMDFVKDGLMPPTNQVAIAGAPGLPRPGAQMAMANMPRRPSGALGQPAVHVINSAGGGATRTLPARPTRLGSGMASGTGGNTLISTSAGIDAGDPGSVNQLPVLSPEQQTQLIREQVNFGQQINLDLPPVPPVPGLEDLSPPTAPPVLPGEAPQFPFPQVPQ